MPPRSKAVISVDDSMGTAEQETDPADVSQMEAQSTGGPPADQTSDADVERARAESLAYKKVVDDAAASEAAELERARKASLQSALREGVDPETVGEFDGFGGGKSSSYNEADVGTATHHTTAAATKTHNHHGAPQPLE